MAAVAVGAGVLSPVPASAAPDGPTKARQFRQAKPVEGRSLGVKGRGADSEGLTTEPLAAPVWPAPGVAETAVPDGGRTARAGNLPVWVAAPGERARAERVQVQMLDRKTAGRAGVQGVLFTVGRVDGGRAAGRITVGLSYSGFASAFGGSYGSRLRLVRYPACVLTTPERAECRRAVPVPTANDPVKQTLTAQVDAAPVRGAPTPAGSSTPSAFPSPSASVTPRVRSLSGALTRTPVAAEGTTVLAAETGTAGDKGDYGATQLSASSTWQAGSNTGEFTWSYPMRVPPVPGGLAPKVAISYSSGAVDGKTSNANAQSSWVGEGFELWPGFIERRYKSCEDEGAPKDQWGNSPGDLCWGYGNATLTWNGRGGELIPASDGTWRLKNDDGTRIEKLTGTEANTDNGDDDNEYWKVTTTDGARYYFGKHRLPGWSEGKPGSGSTWTVPVFGDDSGEPCHKTTGFSDSWCQQAWRWNLDYAVDPNGNAIAYHYDQEVNYYGRNLKPADETRYVRGGTLARIEYGLRDNAAYAKPPARVVFTSAERCLDDTATNCDPAQIDAHEGRWADTPYDLNCKSGTECKDFNGSVSPTFWTRKLLTAVTTQTIKPDGADWRDVDHWALTHRWGTSDSDYTLLPTSIQHTGRATSAPITLPKVTLTYVGRDNRVPGTSGSYMRERLYHIADDSGGTVTATYSTADCSATSKPTPETNTRRCFPVYWAHDGGVDPTLDWFHKYVVTSVQTKDRTGNAPDQITEYSYEGGAAWHFDDDDGLTKEKYKTWSQWRGYGKVIVRTGGDTGMTAQTDRYFLRGMHGDRTSRTDATKTRTVTVDHGNDGEVTDHAAFAGHELRTVPRNGIDGPIVSWTQKLPRHFQTASKTRSWGTVTADITVTRQNTTFTNMGGGSWRQATVLHDHEADTGRLSWSSDLGGPGGGDDRCTRHTYADNTGDAWMRSYVARTEVTQGSCAWTGLDRTQHVISDVRTFYDGTATQPQSAFKSVSKGRVTYTDRLVSHAAADGSQPTYQKVSAVTGFDGYGRPTHVQDAHGNVVSTVTTQTPTSGGLDSKITLTGPPPTAGAKPHTTTTTLYTPLGRPLAATDPAGGLTETHYDALGRLTNVWLPDRDRGRGFGPSMVHTYQTTENKIVAVGTQTVTNDGTMSPPTWTLYDGHLRPRQTQAPGPNGGRVITDTFYTPRGQVHATYPTYFNRQAGPTPALFGPVTEGEVQSQIRNTYDGLGRTTRQALREGTGDVVERYATTYAYGVDAAGGLDTVTVTPPTGGTPTTTYTDARGRKLELRQYNAATPAGTDYVTTRYGYDNADRLIRVTGPTGKVWTYDYDTRGRKTHTTDPDRGATQHGYDNLDRLTWVQDERGNTGKVFHDYDNLGRKLRTHAAGVDGAKGPLIASWGYDTVRTGALTFASRHAPGPDGVVREYKTRVDTYDSFGRPAMTSVIIPEGETGLTNTYSFGAGYNPDGTLRTASLPEAGGLPAEILLHTYNDLKQPTGLSGIDSYVDGTGYTNIGQLQSLVMSSGGPTIHATYGYDPVTGQLTGHSVIRENINGYVRDATYAYDHAGNVTRITDQGLGGTDTQCFDHDHLRRLTDAWTQNTTTCATDPATATIAGPDPYRIGYGYDDAGNRTWEKQYDTTGNVQAERTYTYAGQPGAHTSVTGHMLGAVTQTGTSPIAGTPAADAHETYQYDTVGNTQRRTIGGRTQTFDWNHEGEISKITDTGGTDGTGKGDTTYVYTADGDRLISRDPDGTTLYLPGGMELTVPKNTATATATRYYTHAGQTLATRTTNAVTFLTGDHQGTSQIAIDGHDLTQISKRRTTPFGQPRSRTEGTTAWPALMDKGYVGGTNDPTGLTHLSAREYNPDTGRFVSIDPLFNLDEPQSWNGYAYAGNNPVTLSDPDGLDPYGCSPSSESCVEDNQKRAKEQQNNEGSDGSSGGSSGGGSNGGGGSWVMNKVNRVAGETFLNGLKGAFGLGKNVVGCIGKMRFLGTCGAVAQALNPINMYHDTIDPIVEDVRNGRPLDAAGKVMGLAILAVATRGAGRVARPSGRGRGCSSFVPGTLVLMADGTHKPIEDIEVGDKVMATDPETGETKAQPVTATITTAGEKELVEITVGTGVLDGGGPEPIIATDEHPFWVPGILGGWTDAGDLRPGMWLHTNTGAPIKIKSTRARTTPAQRVHNLTIADTHTYYALASDTPILVHNCDGEIHWVNENANMSPAARTYDAGAIGSLTGKAPALQYYKAGSNTLSQIKFDGYDAVNGVMIDRKLNVTGFPKTYRQAQNQSLALEQNGLGGVWEVPNAATAAQARRILGQQLITNIKVRIVAP
ncbi:polymorphic toxin-type HINT domain-containing protein [Thermomonospora umbrina]|uniref:polymorphic toxin-type HINT domain-containing protein n=1 Tax=Thermomonospora umbrina TaxID=111806 RepID=UPI0011C19D23|nr:polymorphic toxin-type HINT domain-containing protein [Thermomonospora umbrina]